jgi:hypothetical protein
VVVLAGAVFGLGGHDFGRDIAHAVENDIGGRLKGTRGGRWLAFSVGQLLEPRLKCKASRIRFRFQRRRLFIGKLDYRYTKSSVPSWYQGRSYAG